MVSESRSRYDQFLSDQDTDIVIPACLDLAVSSSAVYT